jgi:hypothetical protein
MKNVYLVSLFLLAIVLLAACTQNLDPLSPGVTDGQYALGMKSLVPLALGNTWVYNVVLYDTTTGAPKPPYMYTLSVIDDTVKVDTNKIPIVSPHTNRVYLYSGTKSLKWYRLQGEMGAITCWQIDGLDNLCVRKTGDTLYLQQTVFNFQADTNAMTASTYIGADTVLWASGDIIVTGQDSVKSQRLKNTKTDTLRTTLGSAPFYKYRLLYSTRKDSINYYFKPGFGIVAYEKFQRKLDGTMVRVRRDELASYYFK